MTSNQCQWDLMSGARGMSGYMGRNSEYSMVAINLDLPRDDILTVYDMVRRPGKFIPGAAGKPYMIGMTKQYAKTKNLAKDYPIPLDACIRSPAASRLFMREYDKAAQSAGVGRRRPKHTGLSPLDLAQMLQTNLQRAKMGRFASEDFRLAAPAPQIARSQQN